MENWLLLCVIVDVFSQHSRTGIGREEVQLWTLQRSGAEWLCVQWVPFNFSMLQSCNV